MKKMIVFSVLFALCAIAATDTRTVCASGCNFTSAQAAVDAVIAGMNTACDHNGVVRLRAGETFTPTAHPLNVGLKTCGRQLIIEGDGLADIGNRRVLPADAPKLARLGMLAGGAGTAFSLGCSVPGAILPNEVTCNGAATVGVSNVVIRGVRVYVDTTAYWVMDLGQQWVVANNVNNWVAKWSLLPRDIVLDRILIEAAPGVELAAGVKANGTGITIKNSSIVNILHATYDSPCVHVASGRAIVVENNYLACGAGGIFVGGSSVLPLPRDGAGVGGSGQSEQAIAGERNSVTVRGNQMERLAEWYVRTGATLPALPCYEGAYFQVTSPAQWYKCQANETWATSTPPPNTAARNLKVAGFELKDGSGLMVGNRSKGGWISGQDGQCFHASQSAGPPHYAIRADVRWNYCDGSGSMASAIDGNSSIPSPLPHSAAVPTVKVRNNLGVNMWHPDTNGGMFSKRGINITTGRGFVFSQNTLHYRGGGVGAVWWSMIDPRAGDSAITDHYGYDENNEISHNVVAGVDSLGYIVSSAGTWCNFVSNAQRPGARFLFGPQIVYGPTTYTTSASCPSSGNLPTGSIINGTAASTFTAPGTDWTINSALTAAKGTAPNGLDWGAHIPTVTAATATAASGKPYQPFGVQSSARPAPSSALVYFVAPAESACTVSAATNANFAASTGSVSVFRRGRAGVATISGLSAGRVFVRLACDTMVDDAAVI